MSETDGTAALMRHLTERLNLSPQWQDRLGWLCAAGAMACLTSAAANWSASYPLKTSPTEPGVFSNLAERRATPIEVHRPSDLLNASPMAPAVSAEREARHPRFVYPAVHRDSHGSICVRLSGRIEAVNDEIHP